MVSNPLRSDGVGWALQSAYRAVEDAGGGLKTAADVLKVAAQEQTYWSEYPLPLRARGEAWRHGFTSRDYVLLNLEENDPNEYLSYLDQARSVAPALNEAYMDVLRNKLAFYRATRPYVDCVPETFGTVRNGQFDAVGPGDGPERFPPVVEREGAVVVKPIAGTMGRDVYKVRHDGDAFTVNGDRHSTAELRAWVRELDGYFVSSFVEQHPFEDRICAGATNTVRILTAKDPATGELFVASAVHRFGNASTGPTDNWSGGGFAAPVDVETGELDPLVTYSAARGRREIDHHPDSGARVADTYVPEWDRIKRTVLEVARVHEEIPYVGWDVVLSADGPMVLEGNTAPHLALQQLGEGLLTDERVRRLFDQRG